MLPSEALNREFVMADAPMTEKFSANEESPVISTHAVLIGNIGLLLPRKEVSELVENLPICRLPNTSSWFNGVTSLRGNMIPVFDLHNLFDIGQINPDRKLIIAGAVEAAVGFWVDEMPRMVTLTADDAMNSVPPIPQHIRDHARSFYLKDDQIWIDWDIKAFFTVLGNLV